MRLSTLYIDLKKLPVGLTTHTHTETHISTCFQRTVARLQSHYQCKVTR